MNQRRAIAGRRAVLKKAGEADVSVAVVRHDNGGFEVVIDGNSAATWPKHTPQQVMSGNTPAATLDGVWGSVLSKYPGYSVTQEEEVVPAA
jgi:hypothetical protein